MSNYDWFDRWDPDEDLKRDAPAGHCGSTKEHPYHIHGTEYKQGEGPRAGYTSWPTYTGAPYFKCPGTQARAERWLDVLVILHDDGTVTWRKPDDLAKTLRNINENRKLAEDVALQSKK